MKQREWNKAIELSAITVLVLIGIVALLCGITGKAWAVDTNTSKSEQNVGLAETYTQSAQMFDTHALNDWCSGYDEGTIRMVEGFPIEYTGDSWLVEDGYGQMWEISVDVEPCDFLLLWIADNHTPNNVEDDVVIKTWREAH